MSEQKAPKKSETLEVRVEHQVKLALMHKAQSEGRSASDVVRESIGAYLADQPKESRSMLLTNWKPAAAVGAVSAIVLWTAVTSQPAAAAPDLRAAFATFDKDGDGTLTAEEFMGRSPDTLLVMKADAEPLAGSAKPFMLPLRSELPAPAPEQSGSPEQFLRAEFAKQDGDRNGSVSFAEFERFHLAMLDNGFAGLDLNRDGTVDRAEFEAATKGAPKGPAIAGFDDVDSNRDGRITKEEFVG